ncbi:HAD family phosphatase, partial [Listeria monocytogenes]|nr:HAD family phosphatase [Listeria monocytogenes]
KDRMISLEEVMTIGDNLNDVSMLQLAGVSFAMGNGELEVKEAAKYLTDTNIESGVGKAIVRAIDENL